MGDARTQFRILADEAEKQSFLHKWTSYQFARVCSTRIYKTIKSSNQTNTCVEKAARYYYNKVPDAKFLMDLEALDSHTFDRSTEDESDKNSYYHVNFKAREMGSQEPSLFFAELKGEDGPERVNICKQLTAGDLDNCIFCTGIWHPYNKFVGCTRKDSEEAVLD